MSGLMAMALAPTLACIFYVYIRDKYEKEPWNLLVTGIFFGIVITMPIIHTENYVTIFTPNKGIMMEAFYHSFFVAALVEEFYKYVVLFYLVWRNNNFNEHFDGIVYAVFISLGFAGIENILYVLNPELGGIDTAISRAIFSVPGHALFGVSMGYYFSIAKYEDKKRYKLYAFIIPWLLHGLYNFILLAKFQYMMAIFIPFVFLLWINGFKKMKTHIKKSPFKEY